VYKSDLILLADNGGRYSFKNQPDVCRWNLEMLAEALSPVVPVQELKKEWRKYDEGTASLSYLLNCSLSKMLFGKNEKKGKLSLGL
jgi:uncharacterized protein YdiU (UPF0061 family)